jgi:hypothetical protein
MVDCWAWLTSHINYTTSRFINNIGLAFLLGMEALSEFNLQPNPALFEGVANLMAASDRRFHGQ